MNTPFNPFLRCLGAGVLPVLIGAASVQAASPKPDVGPAATRDPVVVLANKLAQQVEVPRMAADVKSPFNPPDSGPLTGGPARTGSNAGAPRATGARAILELATPAIRSSVSGSIVSAQGAQLLIIKMANGGSKMMKIGETLTINIENTPYPLELVSIDRTTFTLRYQDLQQSFSLK